MAMRPGERGSVVRIVYGIIEIQENHINEKNSA